MWDLTVSAPDRCLSFYFVFMFVLAQTFEIMIIDRDLCAFDPEYFIINK